MFQNSVDEIQCSCQFSVEYLVHEFIFSACMDLIQQVEFSPWKSVVEFSRWNSVHGIQQVHGIQCMEFGAWNSADGIQCMEFSRWNSVHGIQQVEFSAWNSAGGIQCMGFSRWVEFSA